jgi:hypothetical protein
MSGPIECTSLVTRIAMNLGCPEMTNLAYIKGDAPVLGLDHFIHTHILCEKPDHSLFTLYGRKAIWLPNPGPLTVLLQKSYNAVLSDGRGAPLALQDHLAFAGKLAWRQHCRPRLHCKLTLRSPNGTLGMGVTTWVTMGLVVITPRMVIPSLASELEPLPLPSTLTGTLLWSGMSVMGLTRLSAQWKGSDD